GHGLAPCRLGGRRPPVPRISATRQSRTRAEPVMGNTISFVGMDVHKHSLHLALIRATHEQTVQWHGTTQAATGPPRHRGGWSGARAAARFGASTRPDHVATH